jgi:hypothetical protein
MKHILKYGYLILLITGCEEVVKLDLRSSEPRLVVEGLITDEDTTYEVKLSETSSYTFHYSTSAFNYETGALVVISDNAGTSDTLPEVSPGVYKTTKIRGRVGQSYQLEIFTNKGKHFKSYPEEMVATPKIDSLYYYRDTKDKGTYTDASKCYFYVNWQDPPGEHNYYLRKFTYYWQDAWHDSIEWKWSFNDKYFDGKYMDKYQIIEGYSGTGWYLYMDQYSLSKRAYDFWKILHDQTQSGDNDYSNISAPLIGNVYNVDQPDDYVLGYFQVSAKVRISLYINK